MLCEFLPFLLSFILGAFESWFSFLESIKTKTSKECTYKFGLFVPILNLFRLSQIRIYAFSLFLFIHIIVEMKYETFVTNKDRNLA